MRDIEAIFYQVWIPKCQRSMLRFFWWEGNNINNQPTDHQMCVYGFGNASSSNCCNYALKRTVIVPEAVETLMRNSYVNDLLKSTPDPQSAVSLKTFKAGRFKLGKFISNNTVVLKSLQEDQIETGCQRC